jgi:hypothetical protein
VADDRRPRHDRLERGRRLEASLRQRRYRERRGLNGDKKQDLGRLFRILVLGDRRTFVVRDVMGISVPAEVGVDASGAVMSIVVVIQVRMHQRCTQCRQMKGDGQRNRDDRSQHTPIVGDTARAVKRRRVRET